MPVQLSALDVPLGGGIHLAPSRFSAPLGTLTNCRNFEVVDGTYEESQGLTILGPTLSTGLVDFWHMDLTPGEVVETGTIEAGDILYWYDIDDGVTVVGSARIYYASLTATEAKITIDQVTGQSPRRAIEFYTSSGATLSVTTLVSGGNTFTHQSQLGLSWSDYQGAPFLGALVTEQKVQSATWDAFKPDPLGVQGISGVFQLNDDKYAVRDFWGGRFTAGAFEPNIGDEIEVNYGSAVGSFIALVAGYELTDGSWEEGDAEGTLYLYPSSTTTLDMSQVDNWDDGTTIVNNTQTNDLGTTLAAGERQYNNKGLLWKLAADAYQGGWQLVDTGFSLSFDSGEVAPVAELAPLIITDQVSAITETGFSNTQTPATEYPSTGTYSLWSGLTNIDSSTPGAYASTTIATEDYSNVMEANLSPNIPGNARILGVELQLTCHQAVGTDVQINKIQLKNNKTGATQYLSANRAENETLNATPGTTYTYGAQLDLWELDEITQEDLNNGEYSVLIQFYNTNNSSTRVVNVDLVQLNFHYGLRGQKVYFYDGSTDVTTATVYAFQVFDGDWSTDDAEGWYTLYDVLDPSAIVPGVEIRSAASGGGDLLGKARTISKNLLPSLAEMDAENAIYQSRKTTFSGETDEESIYVATGAGPAFSVDGDGTFSFIRLPIDRTKDKPRYVEAHRNHLLLATGAHLLVSSIGSPNNFATYDGATTWNPKDRITGLAANANGSTMVACQDSLHLLTGSGATGQDSFALRMVTDNSGARDYSITSLLGSMYLDYSGLTTADISDKYGGFDLGRRAPHAKPLFDTLLGKNAPTTGVGTRLIAAIPVRKKNQYRMYLSNGEILTATFPNQEGMPVAYTRQNYTAYYEGTARGYEATFAPTAIDSSVNQDGEETILLGTRLGHVMQVDPDYMDVLSYANKNVLGAERRETLQTWKFFKFLDVSPIRSADPSQGLIYKSAEVYVEHAGYGELNRAAFTDYVRIPEIPVIGSPELSIGDKAKFGDYDSFPGTLVDDYFSWYLDEMTDGLCPRLSKFGGFGTKPLKITSLFFHVTATDKRRDNQHQSNASDLEPADLPVDALIVGSTGELILAGGTGEVTVEYNIAGITGTLALAGNTGTVSTAADLWSWDNDTQSDISFDDDTNATFDGST